MDRCLQLARLGIGSVAPNPMVGAVLVYEDRIIGEGYHELYGFAHAEVNCINSVHAAQQHLIQKATIYVSLEPCVHFGKTPPCTDLIIANKIPKVVIGCIDPFAAVAGKGVQKLIAAGVEVEVGVLEKECKELNRRFFTFHKNARPYIVLKWAQSGNAKIGKNNERVLISNEYTNRIVHKWRSEEASVLVGTTTALADDPLLTTRLWRGKNPLRMVIDRNLRLPTSLHLFNTEAKTIVFNEIKHEEGNAVFYYKISKELGNIKQIMEALHHLKIQSLIVEGGAKLLQSFIDEDLWDEARIISNEQLMIADGVDAPVLKDQVLINSQPVATDIIRTYYHKNWNEATK